MEIVFRTLRANEIDCRVSQVSEKGVTLLLYKDARCDMNLLDETVGPLNWMRSHSRDNANCTVGIWDDYKDQWVTKEDTGTESFTEAEKGLASDSFKRACFNWGIGRELYTAPFVWIPSKSCTIKENRNGKPACYDKFMVSSIDYNDDREIISLEIINRSTGNVCYSYGTAARHDKPTWICNDCGKEITAFQNYTVEDILRESQRRHNTNLCAECMRQRRNGNQSQSD